MDDFNIKIKNYGNKINFFTFFTKKFGYEELKKFIFKYQTACYFLNQLEINYDDNIKEIENKFENVIYEQIFEDYLFDYSFLKNNPSFYQKHPELFVSDEELSSLENPQEFISLFNQREFYFDNIKDNLKVYEILKKKELRIIFPCLRNINSNNYEFILYLALIYGYLFYNPLMHLCNKDVIRLDLLDKYSSIYITRLIDEEIIKQIKNGEIIYDENVPDSIKEKCPEFFLAEDAPKELKRLFYRQDKSFLTLSDLNNHPNWLSYLKDKDLRCAFYALNYQKETAKLFKLFTKEELFNLAKTKCKTIDYMVEVQKVSLMNNWYDLTNRHFMPEKEVMLAIPISDAHKFFSSARLYHRILKIPGYTTQESKIALIKMAYIFGVFDQDKVGINYFFNIVSSIPKKLTEDQLTELKQDVKNYPEEFTKIKEYFAQNNITYNPNDLISSLYNASGKLIFNIQGKEGVAKALRLILEDQKIVLTADEVGDLFLACQTQFDPKFRDFVIENLTEINSQEKYIEKLPVIQKKFKDILAFNSNQKLTLNKAYDYIETNKYMGVGLGNEYLAEVCSIAGYNQTQFLKLQEIYNYGKLRLFSSIPHVTGICGNYQYETLRLYDPTALVIGSLTTCCQKLGDMAEICMEHSMLSDDGRIFIVRDLEGNFVAQSWVWRNQGVICFDNIEVPDKALKRYFHITYALLDVYRNASQKIYLEDEKMLLKLLKEKQITEEEYNNFSLRKITVGLGYNDIASRILNTLKEDVLPVRPKEYNPKVLKGSSLYLDSATQYILLDVKDKDYEPMDNLHPYFEDFKVFDSTNLPRNFLKMLTRFDKKREDILNKISTLPPQLTEQELAIALAKLYNINYLNLKVLIHPNFIILYENLAKEINIKDFWFNQEIDYDIVNKQIFLALEQIKENKEINYRFLNEANQNYIKRMLVKNKKS